MNDCRMIQASLDVLVATARAEWPRAVASHVATCEGCARMVAVERLARGLVAIAARGSAPPPGFAGRVMAAAHQAAGVEVGDFWRPAWLVLPAFGAIAAAFLMLALRMGALPPAPRTAPALTPTSAAERLVSGRDDDSVDAALANILESRS